MNALAMLSIEDLTGEQKELAEIVGIDAYKKLVENYGGVAVYVPKLDTLERQKRNTEITEEYYKGKNVRILAMQYNLTENQIRNILSEVYVRKSQHIAIGQLSMDELL